MNALDPIEHLELFLIDAGEMKRICVSDEIFELEERVLEHPPRTSAEAAAVLALAMNNLLADEDPRLQELAASAQRGVIEYLGGVQGRGIAKYYGVAALTRELASVG